MQHLFRTEIQTGTEEPIFLFEREYIHEDFAVPKLRGGFHVDLLIELKSRDVVQDTGDTVKIRNPSTARLACIEMFGQFEARQITHSCSKLHVMADGEGQIQTGAFCTNSNTDGEVVEEQFIRSICQHFGSMLLGQRIKQRGDIGGSRFGRFRFLYCCHRQLIIGCGCFHCIICRYRCGCF